MLNGVCAVSFDRKVGPGDRVMKGVHGGKAATFLEGIPMMGDESKGEGDGGRH